MRLTAKAWSDYADRLSRLNTKAGQLMRAYLERYGAEDTPALIAYASALVDKYGEGSAELACQMYDAMAEAAGLTLPAAEPAAPAAYGEVAKAVNGMKHSPALLQSAVSRLVKQAGADTTLQNAIRDGAEFAWIPHGDTCAFCLMLASRGWQKAGKRTLKNGHAEHIHANCDCEYAVRFDASTTVAGYDPAQYLAAYKGAEGRTYQEKLNALRRAHYAENRKKITAQKRAAYLIKKRSTAGEVDDLREQHRVPDRKEYDRFRRILGTKAPKTFAEFQDLKYNDPEKWLFLKTDYSRRAYLKQHPDTALPGADKAVLPDGKFTKYLFGGDKPNGLAKGRGITSRLGYDISNWELFRDEIAKIVGEYPVAAKGNNGFGSLYEQKIILYGITGQPANLIIGWIVRDDGVTSLTSVYLKELGK